MEAFCADVMYFTVVSRQMGLEVQAIKDLLHLSIPCRVKISGSINRSTFDEVVYFCHFRLSKTLLVYACLISVKLCKTAYSRGN